MTKHSADNPPQIIAMAFPEDSLVWPSPAHLETIRDALSSQFQSGDSPAFMEVPIQAVPNKGRLAIHKPPFFHDREGKPMPPAELRAKHFEAIGLFASYIGSDEEPPIHIKQDAYIASFIPDRIDKDDDSEQAPKMRMLILRDGSVALSLTPRQRKQPLSSNLIVTAIIPNSIPALAEILAVQRGVIHGLGRFLPPLAAIFYDYDDLKGGAQQLMDSITFEVTMPLITKDMPKDYIATVREISDSFEQFVKERTEGESPSSGPTYH